jgi:hypothetical protein
MPYEPAAYTPPTPPPPTVGFDTRLTELSTVALRFGMSNSALVRLLSDLSVPTIHIGRNRYVNEHVMDFAIFCLTLIGRPDFAAPGSRAKYRARPGSCFTTKADLHLDDPAHLRECIRLYTAFTRNRASLATESVRRLLRAPARGPRRRPLAQLPAPLPETAP